MATSTIMGPVGAINVDDGGAGGLPIIFAHSAGGDISHWSAQLERLRKTRRAIALDLRGHGNSQAPQDGDYRLQSQAGEIEAVVNALGIQRFVLVGHSMGASVAVAFAGMHPERLAGLALVDCNGDPSQFPEDRKRQMVAALESDSFKALTDSYWGQLLEGSFPEVRKRVLKGMKALPKAIVISQVKELLWFDPKPFLDKYQGPVISIVAPANDTPHSLQRYLGLPYVIIPGAGHWLHLDKPDEFNRVLDAFLAGIGRG